MRLLKRRVSTESEDKILTAFIVSSKFCKEVFPITNLEYFQTDYAKKIIEWTKEYFDKYQTCPDRQIKEIFNYHKSDLKEADAENIGLFLTKLSDQYETDEKFNSDYYIDQAVEYFRSQAVRIIADKSKVLLDIGKLDDAEQLVRDYKKVAKETSEWVNPLDKNFIRKTLLEDQNKDYLFTFPGALGYVLGKLERGWLIGILGPMKRGKCVAGDSEILLSNGKLVSIRDLVKSNKKEKVISFNEKTQRFESIQISELWSNGIKDCWEVKTRTGRKVSTTKNHQYLTPSGWKYLEELKIGSYIGVPKHIPVFGENSCDETTVRFLAYIMAEGGCTSTQTTFTNIDKSINDDFKRCCDKLGIGYRVQDSISLALIKANPLIRKLGLYGKSSKTKLIPSFIFQSSKKTISLFLRIFFTCDGSIFLQAKDKFPLAIELTLANEKLVDQISHLLLRFGIVHTKRREDSTYNGKKFPAWRIAIGDQEYVNLFLKEINFDPPKYTKPFEDRVKRSFLDKFPYEVASMFRTELKEECGKRNFYPQPFYESMASVQSAINKKKSIMRQSFVKANNTKTYDEYMNSHILWDQIVSIDNIGQIDTYDVSVPVNHNFIAGDCLVHNTWYLQEFAIHALFERLNVVFISLEMDSSRVAKRIYKRLTAFGEEEKNYAYPTFDCKSNQDNTCTLGERTNHIKLLDEKGQKPTFHPDMKYRVCSACRGKKKRFSPDAWFVVHKREKLKIRNVVKKIQGMEQLFGSNLRLLSYPAYSANISKVKRDIDKLEYIEGFVPDVIVIDYADILSPEDSRQVGRERSDETWKMLKNLSQSKHSLVVTASQSNRSSISKKNITQTDIAEDIRKVAHVDMMISLNQLPDEKRFGIMRIAVIAHREKDFNQLSQCMVLQQLELGQPQLDSEFCNDFKEIQDLREKIADEDIF